MARRGVGDFGRHALAAECERALVTAARAPGAGTRQQLRAAARHFVRRHRCDPGFLGFVLRSVGASSALAVALLGLGAAPARAELAPFQPYPTISFAGQDVGNVSAPAFGDLDGDGDLDLVAGAIYGAFFYLENTGPTGFGTSDFVARTGAANPLNGQDVGLYSCACARRPRRRRRSRPGVGRVARAPSATSRTRATRSARPSSRAPAPPTRSQGSVRQPFDPCTGRPRRRRRPRPRRGQRRRRLLLLREHGQRGEPGLRRAHGGANPLVASETSATARRPRSAISTATAISISSRANVPAIFVTSRTRAAPRPRHSSCARARRPARRHGRERVLVRCARATSTATAISISCRATSTAPLRTSRTATAQLRLAHGGANPLDDDSVHAGVSRSAISTADGDLDLVAGEAVRHLPLLREHGQRRGPELRPAHGRRQSAERSGCGGVRLRSRARRSRRRRRPRPRRGHLASEASTTSRTPAARRARPSSREAGRANPLAGQPLNVYSAPRSATSTATATSTSSRATHYGTFHYWREHGQRGRARPSSQRTGAANPLDGQDVG